MFLGKAEEYAIFINTRDINNIYEFDININFKKLQLHSTGTSETFIKINNDKNVFMTEL